MEKTVTMENNFTLKKSSAIKKTVTKRVIPLFLIIMLLMTAVVSAADTDRMHAGSKWRGKYKSTSKIFRAYVDYKWEPNYTNTEAKLTVTGFGVQCLSKSRALKFRDGSKKKAYVKVSVKPLKGKKKVVKDLYAPAIKFPNAKKGAKGKFGSATFIFKKTSSKKTITVTYGATKGKQIGPVPDAWKGSSKGTFKLTMPAAQPDLLMSIPSNSRGETATMTVVSPSGKKYSYTMFHQSTLGGGDYQDYLRGRGCSTCALTTVVNTLAHKSYTPEEMLKVIKKTNKSAWKTNFSKKPSKQMPIALAGMAKVLKKHGIKYKYGKNNAAEVTAWLKAGKPVIMTIGNGEKGGLSSTVHTVLLLGVQKGKVVIGDSVHRSSEDWGKDGLVKHGKLTVKNMMSYIKYNKWDVAHGNYFYGRAASRN